MKVDEFPLGEKLTAIWVQEDTVFETDELCLDQVCLCFETQQVRLKPLSDMDEIEVTAEAIASEPLQNSGQKY